MFPALQLGPSSSGNDLHNTGPLAAGNRRSLTKTNPNYSYVGDVGTSPDGRRDDSRLVMLRDNRDRPRLASPVTSSSKNVFGKAVMMEMLMWME